MDYYEPTAQDWDEDLRELRVRLVGALIFMLIVTAVGTVGFRIIDPSSGWVRAFFMTAITLTTVGYGQEVPLETDGDLIFTAVLILVGMGCVLYFVSTATAFVLEGQLGHVFRRRRMQKELAALRDHLVVCGSGRAAVYAAQELTAVQRDLVLVADSPEAAARLAGEIGDVPVVMGDATDEDILMAAGIERAAGLVACTDSDHENLVVTLTARQLNPDVRIVASVSHVEAETKVRQVGADAVVSPNFIGGLRMASELIRPTVVTFLDTMLRDREKNLRIDEVRIPEGSAAVGRPFTDIRLEQFPDILLLAVRMNDGRWEYNPPRSAAVVAGTVLIFLGTPEDSRRLCEQLGGEMISVPSPAP